MQVKMLSETVLDLNLLENHVNRWLKENSKDIDILYVNQSINEQGALVSIFFEVIPPQEPEEDEKS